MAWTEKAKFSLKLGNSKNKNLTPVLICYCISYTSLVSFSTFINL